MTVRRPPAGPALLATLSGRFHPRRLRHRLPLAVAAAATVALAPVIVTGDGPDRPGHPVLVAARDLAPGAVIAAGDVRAVVAPSQLAPPGAVTTVAAGTVVRAAIATGEIVVAHRLGDGDGLPARLGPEERAVTLPWPVARPPVVVGDAVDLVGTTASERSGPARTARLVAGATVLAVGDDGVTVSVDESLVASVHRASATGIVDLAITPFRR